MSESRLRVLGGLSPRQFLDRHWQKEPLVVRGAFAGFKDPFTPDELAGLACEPGVDSRLVLQKGGRRPWQVTRGPQKSSALRKLPPTHWTLLVESMDRHSPEVAALASAFPFLPRWRMDDVMISLAPEHGTVDAHTDSYDVFLIQGPGRRRWEVDRRSVPENRPGLDLRILKRFEAQDSWILEPGDMLYVPPGVGHRGVTVPGDADIALTYSVGFRSPSSADLLSSLLGHTLKAEPALFGDAGRPPVADRGEISPADLAALRRFLTEEISREDSDAWPLAAGEAATSGGSCRPPRRAWTAANVATALRAGAVFSVIPAARLSWARLARGRAAIFVNGESRVLARDLGFAAPLLCGQPSASSTRRLLQNPPAIALALQLLRAGVIDLGR
jgi:50S ribosomal protein L16 3-hydroxylase